MRDDGDTLFEIAPTWCMDTNVVLSFIKEDDSEPYSRSQMPDQWRLFEYGITSGTIIAPRQVEDELQRWLPAVPDLRMWLDSHRGMFRDPDDRVLLWTKQIVNRYPVYAKNINYLGDLCVIALAGALGLTVISNERGSPDGTNPSRPKIPNVCADFEIDCVTVMGFLRRERS